MREIKFRAWEKEDSKMIDSFWFNNPRNAETDETIMMQYTGLKDCENKEIYEGDILKDFINEKIYQVFWDDYGMFIFTELNSTSGGIDYYDLEDEASMSCLMIIGNIYEHPHLLTTT